MFQSLKAEFDQHEALLRELERQVEEYHSQGKTEAAERLQQQIHILKVKMEEKHKGLGRLGLNYCIHISFIMLLCIPLIHTPGFSLMIDLHFIYSVQNHWLNICKFS